MDNLKQSVLESVKLLPEQVQSSWEYVATMPLPQEFREAKQIVVSGMGGSALGGRVLEHYGKLYLPIPVEVVTHYTLPEYVDEKTLVVISSYSGNTEETISAFNDALEKNAMIFVITTGGKLKEIAEEEGVAAYIIEPEYNPSKQPRLATGYSIGAIFSLLSSLKLLHFDENQLQSGIKIMRDFVAEYSGEGNKAREITERLYGKIPILIASEHLLGAVHIFKNQLNESAKSFSAEFDLPELNHHLMEGLVNPEGNKHLIFLMFESRLYHERVQKRYPITKEVIEKNERDVIAVRLKSETRFQQVLELLVLGSFIEIYLSEKYDADPIAIPWVDYFKEKLA